MRESVLFYRSFYEALQNLPPEEFKEAVTAMMEYALNGKQIDTKGSAMMFFLMAKPQIDANNKRYKSGVKGGRPTNNNQSVTKSEPNNNQSVTKSEPNNNQSVTKSEPNQENRKPNVKEKEKEKVNNINIYCAEASARDTSEPIADDAEALFEELWEAYPQKRGKASVSKTTKGKLLKVGRVKMLRAIDRYVSECKHVNRILQNGSTFFNGGYLDYLDDDFVSLQLDRKSTQTKLGMRRNIDLDSIVMGNIARTFEGEER